MMDSVLRAANLKKTQLTHIAFANGPGAFTGVRIAASTAQGLSIGLNCPLVAVSTLAVLAQHARKIHRHDDILVALDARMGEAYMAHYRAQPSTGMMQLEGQEQLVKLELLEAPEHCFAVGSGFGAKREAGFGSDRQNLDEGLLPHAEALVLLAQQSIALQKINTPGSATINYLRNQVAEKSKKPLL